MHTTKANRNMKFSDAGGFKQMFIRGSKLESTGQVIAQLMERSGDFSQSEIEAFQQYASNRGRRGIESQELKTHLKPLNQLTFDSVESAFNALRLEVETDGELRQGGQGTVDIVTLNGQPYALKTLNSDNVTSLRLVGPDGKQVEREPEYGLARPASVYQDQYNEGLLLQEHKEGDLGTDNDQPAQFVYREDKSSVSSNGNKNSWVPDNLLSPRVLKELGLYDSMFSEPEMQAPPGKVLYEPWNFQVYNHIATEEKGADHDPEDINQGIAGLGYQGQNEVSKDESKVPGNLLKESELNPQPAASDSPRTEIKLARTRGLDIVARMKDLDQVVKPSHYLITETKANRDIRVHVVEGHQTLKSWAKTQSPNSIFTVSQYLMPVAPGKELIKYQQDGSVESMNFKRRDLPDIARSMASLLEKMWEHGFIDGDIKPENLMWDPSSKTLRAIDIDSFQKMSKKDGSLVQPGTGTHIYLHPNAITYREQPEKSPTLGRDLFSAGMVMLEAALRSRGDDQWADAITLADAGRSIEARREQSAKTLPGTLDNMRKDLNFANDSVEDFAILCIKTSLDYENKRVDRGNTRFERYSENAGPGHPMLILKQHPLIRAR
jgi:serine/threonine protein kinase